MDRTRDAKDVVLGIGGRDILRHYVVWQSVSACEAIANRDSSDRHHLAVNDYIVIRDRKSGVFAGVWRPQFDA